jgi:hypothetical protein
MRGVCDSVMTSLIGAEGTPKTVLTMAATGGCSIVGITC